MDKELFLKWIDERILKFEDLKNTRKVLLGIEDDTKDIPMDLKYLGADNILLALNEIRDRVVDGKFDSVNAKDTSNRTTNCSKEIDCSNTELIEDLLFGLNTFYTEKDEKGISRMYEDVAKSRYAGGLRVAMGCALQLEKRLK